ncbi:hypothetical protein [Kocuria sp.]|uniref:hypothetical protein n=1 Tax=Kocuria sp. TaxID=1871328 RepID=UPI0026E031C5|nr:hypothetical protein [Kocuria sp.]MDO5619278.1 hypothetical protein [Kocuria sp.]
MPRLKTESFTGGDQRWLGTSHGIANCRTAVLQSQDFTAVAKDGVVLSGYPVAEVGGLLKPYNAGGSGGTEVLAGHLFTDQQLPDSGNISVPLYDHGRVRTRFLPVEGFTAPTSQANTTIVYI